MKTREELVAEIKKAHADFVNEHGIEPQFALHYTMMTTSPAVTASATENIATISLKASLKSIKNALKN